jgi:hypothetical protein
VQHRVARAEQLDGEMRERAALLPVDDSAADIGLSMVLEPPYPSRPRKAGMIREMSPDGNSVVIAKVERTPR